MAFGLEASYETREEKSYHTEPEMVHATKIDSMLQSPPKKRPQINISVTQTNKENTPPTPPNSNIRQTNTLVPYKSLATWTAETQFFSQVQDEFKKQQVRNANFDHQIKKLETTTNRIDINIDRILDLLESRSKSFISLM